MGGFKDKLRSAGLPQLDARSMKAAVERVSAYSAFLDDLVGRSSGLVSFDEVSEVRDFDYVGHVYDFQTTTGWIVADSVFLWQCRCVFIPYGQMARDAGPPDEPRDPKGEWTTTGPHTSEEWLGHINERDRARFSALAAKGPLTFYHGTADKAVKAILKRGIVPHGGEGADTWFQWHGGSMQKLMVPPGFPGAARLNEERLGSVYISDEKEAAEQFANAAAEVHPGSGATVLKVTIPADRVADVVHDEMALTMPAYRFHGKIDPKWISVAERSYAGEPFPEGPHGGLQKPKDAAPPLTLYLTVMSDEASGLADFDPGEPRDKIGRWTTLSGNVGHPATISTSNVSGKGLEAAASQYRRVDLKAMQSDERVFKENMDLFRDGRFYPGMRPEEVKGSPESIAHAVTERMRSNLDFLAKAVKAGEIPGVEFEANRGWYEGAHTIAESEAKASGIDIASASGAWPSGDARDIHRDGLE
jgi:hypothetical protein